MRMHILTGGFLQMRRSVFYPDADRAEKMRLPVNCYLLRHPRGNVLFDTGCHPAVATEPEARWGGLAKFMTPVGRPEDNLVDQLAELGLTPDDIDLVINSHLHTDHCGCNRFFRRAEVRAHAQELEYARRPDALAQGIFSEDWAEGTSIRSFSESVDIFGDGRLILLPVPGHTPGMTAALVHLESGDRFVLASDCVPMSEHLLGEIIPRNTWNPELLTASLAELRRIQSQGYTVLCGHDPVQWDTLRTGALAYE